LSGPQDGQRGRVYAWENRIIAPRDTTFVAFARAQPMVDAIWTETGLEMPACRGAAATAAQRHAGERYTAFDFPARENTFVVPAARISACHDIRRRR
jgi:hypothetical protein